MQDLIRNLLILSVTEN